MRRTLRSPLGPEPNFVGREVSCGVLSALLGAADESDIDLGDLVAGTGFSVAHYRDPTERIPWSALQTITERLGQVWSTEELREVGARSIEIQHFEPLMLLARLLLTPAEAYAFVIRGNARGDFACVYAETRTNGQRVSIEATISPGYEHAPVFFEFLSGAAEALPTLFGLGPASVALELTERGATWTIDVPPGGGRWSWIDRVRRRFWQTRGLNDVRSRLAQHTDGLETAVAKRLVVEEDLRAALDEHQHRLANLNDVVVELDDEDHIIFVSPNVEEVLGVRECEFAADAWRWIRPPESEPSSSWMTRLPPTGRWIEVNPSRRRDAEDSRLLVLRDVTERMELSAQLATARRLESLGVMASGLAHDFNNLLVPIVANSRSILDELADDSPLLERVAGIESAAKLCAQLVDQILTTTGKSVRRSASCDVAAVVRSLEPLLTELAGAENVLEVIAHGTAPAEIDRDSLSQLATNLVLNAAQAITSPGTVSIRVEQPTPDQVVLSVADDGRGMSVQESERMSEPFFTTKPGGRGLGLASLAGLVHSGAATLEITTGLGQGTEIRVAFSAATAGVEVETAMDRGPAVETTTARVLLVDDDEVVRSTIAGVLSSAFDVVVGVSDVHEAANMMRNGERFDCLVTDLTMPVRRGPGVISDLRDEQPGLPALLITGAGRRAALDELAASGFSDVTVVAKPFEPAELVAAIRFELDRAAVGEEPGPR